jgi:gluconolactonase
VHRAQGFKPEVHVEGQLYRIRLDGVVDAMASNYQRPNGLAFSEDEKRLYVTDTGFLTGYVNLQSLVEKHPEVL